MRTHIRRSIFAPVLLLVLTLGLAAEPVFQAPVRENSGSWSLIMIPDIQNYVKWRRNQPILELMMAWIEENVDPLNIRMVVCVGDLVESNEKIINDYDGNQTTSQQWEAVSRAFARLDGKVPYIAAAGNHEYSIDDQGNRRSHYSEYITSDRNHLNQKILVQNNRNEQRIPTLENSAYEIKNLNGRDYLFLTLEYGPP
jgi:predicted MPP superfamily phosphohydrolase